MQTTQITNQSKILKAVLNQKGYDVKDSEAIDAIFKINSNQDNNQNPIRILSFGEQLTFKELKENNFSVDVVVPIDIDTFFEGIDCVNDAASQAITGSDYALCDIGYEVFPHFYGTNTVAVKVTGYIDDIETLTHLEDFESSEEF